MAQATIEQAWEIIDGLDPDDQRRLAAELQARLSNDSDDWALDGDRLIFMMERHNAIMDAIERDDDAFLLGLAASDEFTALFGDMGWDEAYDRYEEAILENNVS